VVVACAQASRPVIQAAAAYSKKLKSKKKQFSREKKPFSV
jgi:hypothetical protein